MIFKATCAALLIAMSVPFAASAAITQSFSDRATFVTAALHSTSTPLGLGSPGPVFVSDFTSGDLTITGRDGGLAGDGADIVSTELDGDVLILNFATEVFGVGLFGGVTDFDFAYIDGEIGVEAVGSGVTSFVANGGAYFGLLSDVGFTQVRVSINSFDTNISSVGFATLQGSVEAAVGIPEPMTWMTMILGFGLLGSVQRFRRNVSET